MTHPVRVALVGLGRVSGAHRFAISELSRDFVLAAVCDSDLQRTEGWDHPAFASVDEMLDAGGIGLLSVAVPPDAHHAVAASALKRGIDVLVEKPATTSLAEFDDLVTLASASNAVLQSALHFAFGREILWLGEHRAAFEADFGPLTSVRCSFSDPYVREGAVVSWARPLAGSWTDSGINALSVIATLDPNFSLETASAAMLPGYEYDVVTSATLTIGRGIPAAVETTWMTAESRKSTLLGFGTSGTRVLLDHSGQRITIRHADGERELAFQAPTSPSAREAHYLGVYRDAALAIRSRTDNRIPGRRLMAALHDRAAFGRTTW